MQAPQATFATRREGEQLAGIRQLATQRGSALLLAILAIALILALTAGLTMLVLVETQAVAESARRISAFNLAESGFEAAKYEIGESLDPGGDGPGNVTASKPYGSYSVTSVDLGSNRYELTATGSSGGTSVTLKMVATKSSTSVFPPSAMAALGYSKSLDVEISTNALFDGGDSPAIVFTDQDKYDAFGLAFLDAVTLGLLPLGNITGAITNLLGSLSLSLQLAAPAASGSAEICPELFANLVNRLTGSVLPQLSASSLALGSTITYGSSTSPVTVYLNSSVDLLGGRSISGHGTLIVPNELKIGDSAAINWVGNVIVLAASDQDSKLDIEGDLTVTGNLLMVSGSQKRVKVNVRPGASLAVNGAMTLLSDLTSLGTVEIVGEGSMQVQGLLQALGINHNIRITNLGQLVLNGQLGLGPAIDPIIDSSLTFRLDGLTTLFKDTQEIAQGAAALVQLDQFLGAPIFGSGLTRSTMTTEAWWTEYP